METGRERERRLPMEFLVESRSLTRLGSLRSFPFLFLLLYLAFLYFFFSLFSFHFHSILFNGYVTLRYLGGWVDGWPTTHIRYLTDVDPLYDR